MVWEFQDFLGFEDMQIIMSIMYHFELGQDCWIAKVGTTTISGGSGLKQRALGVPCCSY